MSYIDKLFKALKASAEVVPEAEKAAGPGARLAAEAAKGMSNAERAAQASSLLQEMVDKQKTLDAMKVMAQRKARQAAAFEMADAEKKAALESNLGRQLQEHEQRQFRKGTSQRRTGFNPYRQLSSAAGTAGAGAAAAKQALEPTPGTGQ